MLGWREVPIRPDCLGKTARAGDAGVPSAVRVVAERGVGDRPRPADVRRPQADRARADRRAAGRTSRRCRRARSSTRGCSRTPQLGQFYPDLTDPRIESALLLVHSRFSTNTFPSWPLAHPYRYIAHNGEINTVQGNQNWMRAREAMAASDLLPDLDKAFPICTEGASDTARFDEVLELLHLAGRPDPPRRADDDPGGVGEQRRDGPRPAGVLPIPRQRDGAVGRPGERHLHRRHRDRRRARPQRAAPEPLLGHRRRPRDHGVRGGRARGRSRQGRQQGPPAAGADVPDRHAARAGSSTTRRSRTRSPPSTRTPSGSATAWSQLSDLPDTRARRVQPRQRAAPPADVRVHPRGAQDHRRADGEGGRRADRVDGHRHADRRAVGASRGFCSTTSSSCSPRSPTRRSTPSAKRS